MAALDRLKARVMGASLGAPGRASAATAHSATDAYLAAFDSPAAAVHHVDALAAVPARQWHHEKQPAASAAPQLPAAAAAGACCWQQEQPPALAAAVNFSERNLLCASVDWERQEVVLGSADHAAYGLDLRRGARSRTLYSKRAGHGEWVTAVAHIPGDGRVVTGGQDSALWLWGSSGSGGGGGGGTRGHAAAAAAAVPAVRLDGHGGPISQVAAVPAAAGAAPTFVSASYDKKLIIWACASGSGSSRGSSGRGSSGSGSLGAQQQRVLVGHRAPVLELRVAGGGGQPLAASGDRDGAVACWDLAAGAQLGKTLPAHTGHCTALEWWCCGSGGGPSSASGAAWGGAPLLLTGGQDGCVRAWDSRHGAQAVATAAAHAGPAGRGAVGSIVAGLPGGAAALAMTAGADGRVCGLDSRRSLEPAWQARLPDFPYCLASAGSTVFVGCGDGSIVALDAASGQCWALAASSSAVRTLHASAEAGLLLAGCDDGSACLYRPGGVGGIAGV